MFLQENSLNLIHVKLKNGEDLIGIREPEANQKTNDGIWIVSPISVNIHPIHGLFGKSWMMLSEANTVKINNDDIMYIAKANEKAESYYTQFLKRFDEDDSLNEISEDELTDELEDIYNIILESKNAIKH